VGGRRAIRRLTDAAPETAAIMDATPEGDGVASLPGKRVFVAGALQGETVTFRRVRSRSNYDEAELLAVEVASRDRVAPRCASFGRCGGCSLQHLAPHAQLALKERALVESLRRIGGVTPERLLAPVGAPSWGYRRRARLAVRHVPGKGRVLVGFSERDSFRIAEMSRCETLHPAVATLPGLLSDLIGSLSLAARIPQVEVAVADEATALVFRVLDEPTAADLAALREFRDRHGLRILLQRAGPEAIVPLDAGRDEAPLSYGIAGEGLRLEFCPTDFVQVNAVANERMIELALELLQLQAGARVLDLYCGIGNFTLAFARHAGYVLGVEGDPLMVDRARGNAAVNGIGNAEFRVGDLAQAGAGACWSGARENGRFDAVLLDPPRAGAAAVVPLLPATGASRVLYVSCHPGTLARDAGSLVREHGYRLAAAGVLDMFPHTSHIESVALFEQG
jgi:23S rRNA (uracil1939-C5)-methyltransferase